MARCAAADVAIQGAGVGLSLAASGKRRTAQTPLPACAAVVGVDLGDALRRHAGGASAVPVDYLVPDACLSGLRHGWRRGLRDQPGPSPWFA